MVQAIKEQIIVGPAGRVVIDRSVLPEGSRAEVIVLVDDDDRTAPAHPVSLSSLIGSNKGQFKSVEEVDAYLRGLRDEWDQ